MASACPPPPPPSPVFPPPPPPLLDTNGRKARGIKIYFSEGPPGGEAAPSHPQHQGRQFPALAGPAPQGCSSIFSLESINNRSLAEQPTPGCLILIKGRKWPFVKHFLGAGHYGKQFTWVIYLNLYNIPTRSHPADKLQMQITPRSVGLQVHALSSLPLGVIKLTLTFGRPGQ